MNDDRRKIVNAIRRIGAYLDLFETRTVPDVADAGGVEAQERLELALDSLREDVDRECEIVTTAASRLV